MTAAPSVPTLRDRAARHPALVVAAIYLTARVVTTLFIFIGVGMQERATGSATTFENLSMRWDGQWYWLIATQGYPATLPLDTAGNVTSNAWAFMPVYPWLSRAVAVVFGGAYPLAAILVAIGAGYGASLVLFRLLRERTGDTAALWAVALFASGPLAALFQMGYAESLFLLWLFLALLALVKRRYAWLYLFIPLMGFTRPGVLAFALMLGVYGTVRWVRRRTDPLPATEAVHIVFAGLLAVLIGFAWQLIAGYATGDPQAYMETELSWRRGWIGEGAFVPFDGFVQGAALWFRLWGLLEIVAYLALAAAVVAIAAVIAFEPHVRRLGSEMRLWSASYVLYLLVVFFPQSSIFRLLLPLAPLYGAIAAPRHPLWRWGALLVGLIGQWWWIYQMLAIGNSYTQIP